MVSLRLVSMILLVGACGGAGVRYQPLGQGRVVVAGAPAAVGPGASATAGLPAAVAVPADAPDSTYRVDFDVWLPRAAEVDWTIRCGSAAVAGVVGEDFATYQARRLRELAAERERERRAAAAVGAAVGQAVIGQVAATTTVQTPTAQGQATVALDGAAVGAQVGAATVSTDVALPPGDVGQGYRHGTATLLVPDATAGACTMELAPRSPDDAGALGTFAVARLDDTARRIAAQAQAGAIVVRGDLRAQLVARGGDLEFRARQAALAQAAAEAELVAARAIRAQLAASLQAHAVAPRPIVVGGAVAVRGEVAVAGGGEVTVIADGASYEAWVWGRCKGTRRSVVEQLVARGGDRELRARQRQLAFEAQLRIDAEAAAARAAADAVAAAQAQAVIAARAQVVARLTRLGAVVRTPMPPDVDEQPGEPPMAGYAWAGGHWEWRLGQWQWIPGYWLGQTGGGATTTTTATATTTTVVAGPAAAVGAAITGGVTITVGVGASGGTRPPPSHTQDHRPTSHTQDHR